jgi:hypothetical protein
LAAGLTSWASTRRSRAIITGPENDVVSRRRGRRAPSSTVRALAPYVGAVDQFADSTDILDELSKAQALTIVYDVAG